MRHLPFFHARQTRKTTTSTLNPIHKVSPRATIFAAGVESASTARNSSSVLLTVKSPFVQEYFALPLLRASPPLLAFPCLCSSARICSTPLRISSYLFLSESSRIHAFAFPRSARLIYAFASLCTSVPLHLSAYLSPCPSSRSTAQPLQIVSKCFFAMPLRCIAERRVSAQRHCDALPPTPRPALPSRFDTRPCIAFALLIEASLIQAIYAYLRLCAALSS